MTTRHRIAHFVAIAFALVLAACARERRDQRPVNARTRSSVDFAAFFTGATLRFDYHHGGTASDEQIAADTLRVEGEWAGSRTRLLDDTDLGKYRVVVDDLASGAPIWSRGFASIYGEWETIAEASAGVRRVFHESQRFPEPRAPFRMRVEKRGDDGEFREIFRRDADPADRAVDRSQIVPRGTLRTLHAGGSPDRNVDLLVLGDGWLDSDAEDFFADAARLTATLLETEPFRSRRHQLSVRALHVPAAASGITDPRGGQWNATPLGLAFNAFDSDRYVLTYRNRELRELAAQAPYDTLMILGKTRKYGGGGIFNLWATCASDSSESPYIFVHEFGHSFAGLADEYYTSPVSYENFTQPGVEPWEPNITALLDPAQPKWRELVTPGTALPTPWNQSAYDAVSREYQRRREELVERGAPITELEALFDEVKRETGPMLAAEQHAHAVGAFEGAGYEAKGLYRPQIDCLMFTRNPGTFCQVCSDAIERVIDLYTQ